MINKNFKKSKIDYGNEIKKDRETICNFSQQENFVVLECVNRLLEKGYEPDKIYLEKDWKVGRKEKGNLDIQILDENNKSFLMIECKTFGKEFDKEESKMQENGGQLFSYYIQDKETKYLCLYSSKFENSEITYKNNIVKIIEDIKNSNNNIEAFENWKPQVFETNGIFENEIKPYVIEFKELKKKDLIPLSKEDGRKIFNRFAEILRRNVVSDKTNSYNKIFNLFLCKIVDEYETGEEDSLKFQWIENETNEDALLRLNELYKRGMEHYLGLEISAVDIEKFEKTINNIKNEDYKEHKKQAIDLFIKQKLYSSNDFAFKEVFDKNTFDLNCQVVKEVVKMLEGFKIKYETKQQFLGDFFEKLLNTGIKQEVGQFFTPVPIAQFVCKCLPIEKIIKDKIKNEEHNVLPYLIDYASGAGHFITESMEEINNIIQNINESSFKNQRALKNFKDIKNNFNFAKEYIYGIEKDYRLAKTTKVATYLNGDGDAKIILGDGLDNFYESKDYKDKLKLEEKKKDNENFDIVVANPPFSVSGFKNTLNYGKESFDLFKNFTNKSGDIECLFVERTKQLLNFKYGVGAVVLPNSILTNSGIYEKTRELILNNFEVKGIVELGSKTFMKTGSNTIILFLKKIENKGGNILRNIEKSINEKKDLSINNIEKPISKFLKNSYQIDFNTYLRFFENENLENEYLNKIEIYEDYIKQFEKQKKIESLKKFVREEEINKLKTFILTYNKKVVISNIPLDNKEEKQFLGYEFSERKGYEGINIFDLGGKLYNPNNLEDETKVNYYIYNNFLDKKIEKIDEEATSVKVLNLNDCINFKTPNFEKVINLKIKKEFKTKYELKYLGEIFSEKESLKNGVDVKQEDKPLKYLVSRIETIWNKKLDLEKVKYTDDEVGEENFLKNGDILMSHINSLTHIGKSAFVENLNKKVIHGINILKFRNFKKETLNKYVYLIFQFPLFINLLKFYAKKAVHQASIATTDIKNIKIPIPPKEIQEKIIKENEDLENEEEKLQSEIEKLNKKIEIELNIIKQRKDIEYKEIQEVLSDNIKTGATPFTRNIENWKNGRINWLNIKDMNEKYIKETLKKITEAGLESKNMEIFDKGVVLFSIFASLGKIGIIKKSCALNQAICALKPNLKILSSEYLYYILKLEKDNICNLKIDRTQENLNSTKLKTYKIPVIKNLEKQNKFTNNILKIENKISQNEKRLEEIKEEKNKIIEKYLLEE